MVISFDFDDTVFYRDMIVNQYVIDLIHVLIERGDEVYIVSRRKLMSLYNGYTNEEVRELIYKIDPSIKVIFCNNCPKWQILKAIDSITHYDNAVFELETIKKNLNINLVLVMNNKQINPFHVFHTK